MLKIGSKIICFTDIHLGLHNNDKRHNEECLEFIKWMKQEADEFGAETSLFLGDWTHNRNSINVHTLNYSNAMFQYLNKNFKKHYHILGNHDLYFREHRDVNGVKFAENLNNIQIINDITIIDDIVLSPWLMKNEYKKITKLTQPCIFGHFEFPHFLMNSMTAMPDVGVIKIDDFKTNDQHIFSGHFHKRQSQKNLHGVDITYIGNCFPHNFSDANDDDRGIMLLEIGKQPIYKKWPKAPKYRNILLSDLIEDPDKYLDCYTVAKVQIDMNITYEEANAIRSTITNDYQVRELRLLPNKTEVGVIDQPADIKFESVEQIVINQLGSIDSKTVDKQLLLDIWYNV